jgi:hypothetical protein
VPLGSAEEVFRTVCGALGERLARVPDGETGPRADFIGWQSDLFLNHPQFEASGEVGRYNPRPKSRLRAGVKPEDVRFDRLGYAQAALASYPIFSRLKTEGVIPPQVRFQVCLPSPLAPVQAWITETDQPAVRPAYFQRMLEEVDEIAGAIPHAELAMQWDVASEMLAFERMGSDPAMAGRKAGILDALARAGNRVPPDVELGYHLCYGDFGHQHALQPQDTGKLVEVANGILDRLQRPLTWLHLPVPRDRDDAAYFAPLSELRLPPSTGLYLGLVHLSDGAEGTRRRAATARGYVRDFGVATECGWGRRDPSSVPDLLRLHAEVAGPAR